MIRKEIMRPKGFLAILTLVVILAIAPGYGYSKTIVLEGSLDSSIVIKQQMSFSVQKPLSKLSFKFALPAAFKNRAVSQGIKDFTIGFDPEPEKVEDETDAHGNRFKKAIWNGLNKDARVSISFNTHLAAGLSAMESKTPFPIKSIPQGERTYLKGTELVQTDNPEIITLSRELTRDASTEYEAVTSIINYVADSIKYTYNPPQYDALHTLKTRSGNCQNFAHLCMALLRAAGVPARIVGGISLKEPWKIPLNKKDSLVQSMGQGGHAWMEVFFPDLGWLSYDPQQSKQFTSSRHIKQTHGLDSRDINDSWRAAPYLPEYNEFFDAKFLDDTVSVKAHHSDSTPRAYLLSNNVLARSNMKPKVPDIQKPLPGEPGPKPRPEPKSSEEPKKPIQEEPKPQEHKVKPPEAKDVLPEPPDKIVEFGNREFPNLVNIYKVVGDKGVKIFDKETAEYVTSRYVYAQAFEVDKAMSIESVSLALRKFGGDGAVYIDLVTDREGRPELTGLRSMPVFLESVARRPGYYWLDFRFPSDANPVKLGPGKYWVILRHSGEVIMNWFYIPGNPYGDCDDTRSTLKGYEWQDIQNYDFVFKVRGLR